RRRIPAEPKGRRAELSGRFVLKDMTGRRLSRPVYFWVTGMLLANRAVIDSMPMIRRRDICQALLAITGRQRS
ncbi:MAG TPA: hypothetical protein VJ353_15630, partial [Xanthobacteraceae bacterium]|nr:hypothetical protein [Xanthobacteraceae bacterium]